MIGAGLPPLQITPHAATASGVGVWITLAFALAMLLVFVATIWVSARRMRRVEAGSSAFEAESAAPSERRAA
jgi:uncharacterized membrane protein YhaH (DUF805 family)